jgi:dTMP kinase
MSEQKSLKGLFVTLEGTDGVGKSTQSKLLAQRIAENVIEISEVYHMREPGGDPACEDIRTLLKKGHEWAPICELMLFNAARNQLVNRRIIPAIENGHIAVCDRFIDSTVAYQHFGNGIPLPIVQQILQIAIHGVLPDLTIMLVLDEDESRRRAGVKDGLRDGIEKYDVASGDFKKRVSAGFAEQAKNFPKRIKVVNALGEPGEVCNRIWDLVRPLLAERGLLR